MADKQVKVAKPKSPKPTPVKPTPVKPTPIKPIKAEGGEHTCVRCNHAPATIRMVCGPCDLALQELHWNVEYQLFRRTVYIPKTPHDGGPSLDYLISKGYAEHMRKPQRPFLRSNNREKTTALTM